MAQDITSLVIKVSSDGIREANTSLGNLSNTASTAEKRVASLDAAMGKINAANRMATTAADSYITKLREQASLMQGMAANSRVAAGGTQALAAAMTLLSTSLNLMNQNLQQAEVHQRRHNNSMLEGRALARGLSGSLGALWMTYGAFTGMAVGVAIGASLKGIVSVGKDVEHTLEGIRVRGNETTESIDNIRKSVMDLGQGVYGPQEVAKAFETLVLAGLKADQAISSISAALNLATVGGVSIEKAATTLVSVGTAIGFTAEGFGRVGDVIAKTAALSMSSVETLSQAFKSASSVNRLYGISLEDIGTSLGVLSNLGIQGSAAGTALKNFYKELAAESDKVGSTLHKMNLSQAAFKDADGNFKPLLEVVTLLDEGLNKLSKGESKLAQGRLSNERGQRLMTQLLGEYNTKLGDSDNALARFRRNVENSYGFAAKGAVQMALTAKSQVDSMFNTLKTSFAETFTSIQPEVIAFSSRMKAVFGSKDFKDAIAELARWFAKLAMAIAENIPLLTKLAVGLIAVKAAMIGASVWQAAAAGIASIGTAITGLMAGTLTLTAALPALAVVLGVVAVAWTAYNLAKGEDLQKQAKDAQAYASGYISGLTKEAETLDKVNAKMRQKKSLLDANAEVERDESRQKMVGLDQKAIAEAEKNLYEVTSKFSFNRTKQLQDQKEAQSALNKARENAANNTKLAAAAEATLFAKAKENADLAKANADKSRDTGDRIPTATLGGKTDTKGINDAYHEAIKLQEGYLTEASHAQAAYDKQQQSMFKAGMISKLEMIENISIAQIAASMKTVNALQAQEDAANKRKDGKSDAQGFHNKRIQEITDQGARVEQVARDNDVYLKEIRQASAKLEIKELEEKGQWVKAEQLRYEGDTKAMYDAVSKAVEKYGDKFPELIEYQKRLKATQDAAMDTAKVKEAYSAFEVLRGAASNLFKGVIADNEGLGIAGVFSAAQAASEEFATKLPDLQEKLLALKVLMDADPKSDDAAKNYNKALSEMQQLANNQKTMWASVGESISKSLGDAFGSAGKAAGKLFIISQQYGNTQEKLTSNRATAIEKINKSELLGKQKELALSKVNADFDKASSQARIHAYGDMAGAAKMFFNEGSSGYKLLSLAEQGFRAVELAGMLASVNMTVITEGAKNIAKIPGVIMSFMSTMGPWGWAAAAVAIAAVLGGGAASGSGGAEAAQKKRIETQGSGTVLGDSEAKSESIVNSLKLLSEYAFSELEYSNKMLTAMQNIAASLTGVSKSLVLTQGLMTGTAFGTKEGNTTKFGGSIFGGNTSTNIIGAGLEIQGSVGSLAAGEGRTQQYEEVLHKKNGGLFRRDKEWTTKNFSDLTEEFSDSLAQSFVNVRTGLLEIGSSLGLSAADLANTLNEIPVNLAIETRGLKGKELEEAVTSVFSAEMDRITGITLQIVKPFQQMGEGLLETAVRVSNSFRVIDLELQSVGMTFGAVGTESMKARMGFIDMMGGLEEFTSKTDFFKDNFLTDAQRLAPVSAAVSKEMARLEQSSITTTEQYAALVQSQDLSTLAGQEMYVALMNVAPAFKIVADAAKELAGQRAEIEGTIYDMTHTAVEALTRQRNLELEALDESLRPLQSRVFALQDEATAAEALSVISEARASLEEKIYDMTHTKAEALTRQRNAELSAMDESLRPLQSRIYALDDEAKALAAATELATKRVNMEIQIMQLQGDKSGALAASRKIEMDAMDATLRPLQRMINALNAQATASDAVVASYNSVHDIATKIKSLVSGISNSVSDSIFGMKFGMEGNAGKYGMLDVRGARLNDQMHSSGDIYSIASIAQEQIALINQAWGLLDPEQQKAQILPFEAKLNEINSYVMQNGADPVALAKAQNAETARAIAEAVKTAIAEAMADPTSALSKAAADVKAAAADVKVAANTPAQANISVSVTAPVGSEVSVA